MAERPPEDPPPTRAQRRPSRELSSGGSEEFSLAVGESAVGEVTTELPEIASFDETNRYATGPLLGSGGMGAVALRRDEKIGRKVAYKTLHADLDTGELRRRFVREARAQGQLEHPAIVPVYDMGTGAEGLYFTMKRVHGHTLARVLSGLAAREPEYVERFTPRRLLMAFHQVCQAVHYAHTRGVVHRDLKPSNVMLGEFGEVYVLDWGLARIMDEEPFIGGADGPGSLGAPVRSGSLDLSRVTSADVVVGTLAYIPPEQILNQPLDARADVYALGIVLYEIVTLERYRDLAEYIGILAEIDGGRVARPSDVARDVDPEIDAICVRATAIDPAQRFASAKELAGAVERVLDGVRDAEARSVAAARHLERARSLLTGAGPDRDETRVEAMHELLRAVTLDPAQADARSLLVDLVSDADADARVPEGAQGEVQRAAVAQRVAGVEATMIGLVSWLLPVPVVLLFVEVRSWPFFWLATTPILLAFALAAYARSRRVVGTATAIALAALLGATLVGVSFLLGPFVIVPTMAATCSMFYAMQVTPRERTIATVILTGAALLPYALDGLGVVEPGVLLDEGRIALLPRMLELPPVPSIIALAWASGSFTVFAAVITGRLRDRLERAERRNLVSAWHLRQLFAPASDASPPA